MGKVVYSGRVFKVEQNGKWELVVHPGAVCIVARPTPDDVILIRQFRASTGGELLEIPAGTLHEGEDPRDCAIRELEEETGYRADNMVERARFWTTPGFTNEFMYLYEASGLVKTQTNFDEDETIEVEIVPCRKALEMVDEGKIQDAKSILGLLRVLK
jgi:ADP-ribose pyrophosphatase